jgi:hypothetical protein
MISRPIAMYIQNVEFTFYASSMRLSVSKRTSG